MFEDITWMTRQDAADWLGCSVDKISRICNEMDEFGVDGVFRREDGKLFRVNQKAISDYLYHRRFMKNQKRRKLCET